MRMRRVRRITTQGGITTTVVVVTITMVMIVRAVVRLNYNVQRISELILIAPLRPGRGLWAIVRHHRPCPPPPTPPLPPLPPLLPLLPLPPLPHHMGGSNPSHTLHSHLTSPRVLPPLHHLLLTRQPPCPRIYLLIITTPFHLPLHLPCFPMPHSFPPLQPISHLLLSDLTPATITTVHLAKHQHHLQQQHPTICNLVALVLVPVPVLSTQTISEQQLCDT